MKKRMLALLLAAVLLLGMIPLASAAEPEAVLPAAQSTENPSPAVQASETTLPAGLAVTYTLNGEQKTAELTKIGTSDFTFANANKLAGHDVLLASLPNGVENVTVTNATGWNSAIYYGKAPDWMGSFSPIQPSNYMEDEDFVDERIFRILPTAAPTASASAFLRWMPRPRRRSPRRMSRASLSSSETCPA